MILLVLIWLCFLSLVGVVLYVLGTYLVYAYDHRLLGNPAESPKLSVLRRLWGITREILATWGCAWMYLWGFLPTRVRPRRAYSIPILLVHGFNHNRSAWFPLRARLRRAGFEAVYTLNLPRGNHAIAEHAEFVIQRAREIESALGIRELVLIGHSMGGLIACACAEQHAPVGKITHVITLGAPLHGTRMAVLAGARAAQEMRVDSPFTQELTRAISSNHWIQYFHLASWFDNIVIPATSALIGKRPGNERMFDDMGHLTLLFSRRVASQVIAWLRASVPLLPLQTRSRVGERAFSKAPFGTRSDCRAIFPASSPATAVQRLSAFGKGPDRRADALTCPPYPENLVFTSLTTLF
jgi:triacylglycerol lipase